MTHEFYNFWKLLSVELKETAMPSYPLFLPDLIRTVRYISVSRRDKVAQAVFYEIASQTGQWSSAFAKTQDPEYDYDRTLRRLRFLQAADRTIRRHLWRRGRFIRPLLYKDLTFNHDLVLKAAGPDARVSRPPEIHRQGGTVNAERLGSFQKDRSPRHELRRQFLTRLRLGRR